MPSLLIATALAVDAQGLQAVDGGRFPASMDADLGVENTVAATMTVHSGTRMLVLRTPSGDRVLLDRVTTQDLQFSLNLYGATRIGFAIPRHRPVIWDGQRVVGAVTGDFALFVQAPLSERAGRRVALSTQLDLPLGALGVWLGESAPALEVLVAAEFGQGRLTGIANLGPRLTEQVSVPGMRWGNAWRYAVGARWEPWGPLGFTSEVFGRAPLGLLGHPIGAWPAEVLATADLRLGAFTLGLGGGTGLTRGLGSPGSRLLGRVDLRPQRASDRDGDGVPDVRDRCPDRPEDADGFEDHDGCPDPDNDGDGIPDALDACPDRAETWNQWRDEDGCPDALAEILIEVSPEERPIATARVGDQSTRIPAGGAGRLRAEAGSVELQVVADGFRPWVRPVLAPADQRTAVTVVLEPIPVGRLTLRLVDADGASLAGWFVAEDGGRVDVPADGLSLDGPAGEVSGRVGAAGRFPQPLLAERTDGATEVVIALTSARLDADLGFDLGSSVLGPLAGDTLDAVARYLLDRPEIRLLRVEGHADGTGSSADNLVLSRERAAAVREALIARGVAPGRLEAIGTGEAGLAERVVTFLPLVWDE